MAITVQPTASIVGAAIRPAVAVTVLDAHGNTATSATTSITLALGSNPAGSTLSGKLTTAAVNGVEEIHPRRWKRAGEQVQRKVP